MKFFLSQKYLLLFIRINHFSLSMQIKKIPEQTPLQLYEMK
ncbi:hypothetical protein ECDEC12B_2787 [Escherichia coli DEC12B]|nr:hypothetical protein ECDEC12B_2787 [Escherichia coli DEC12B]EHX39740.1 hypothetical protein ECDEC12C_5680 [Escherichia coli DEC12C]EIQ69239.1 hypothetical protein ECEPECC34262_3392 [Escherichia coli EPEC C342-62]